MTEKQRLKEYSRKFKERMKAFEEKNNIKVKCDVCNSLKVTAHIWSEDKETGIETNNFYCEKCYQKMFC